MKTHLHHLAQSESEAAGGIQAEADGIAQPLRRSNLEIRSINSLLVICYL